MFSYARLRRLTTNSCHRLSLRALEHAHEVRPVTASSWRADLVLQTPIQIGKIELSWRWRSSITTLPAGHRHHLSTSGRCVRYSLYSDARFHLQPCCIQSHSPQVMTLFEPWHSHSFGMREEHLNYWQVIPMLFLIPHAFSHSLTNSLIQWLTNSRTGLYRQ
jgi:hypothetical protein